MKSRPLPCLVALLLLLAVCGGPLFSQKILTRPPVPPPRPDTLEIEVQGYDKSGLVKYASANPASVPDPYFRYLYIFGDGNFINGVTDSVVSHQYARLPQNQAGGDYIFDVTVYASDTYGGGKPPPDKALADTVIIDRGQGQMDTIVIVPGAEVGRSEVTLNPAADRLTNSPVADIVPVVKSGQYLHLQKNHEFRPKDTSVVIVSLKNNFASPSGALLPISGQIWLFYNGKIEGVTGAMKAGGGDYFADFHHDTTLIYNPNTWQVVKGLAPAGVSDFKQVLVLNYFNLGPGEERHFFFEFANNASLLDYIDLGAEDTAKVKFLAVLTAVDQFQGTGFDPVLTVDEQKDLNAWGIPGFLGQMNSSLLPQMYQEIIETEAFEPSQLPFNGDLDDYPTVVLDMFELQGAIVAAKDPNHLSANACRCGGQKIVYDLEFTNDGMAPTSHIYVNIKIPPELDINSIADTVYFPAASGSGHVIAEQVAPDELRFWMKNYAIFPTAQFGYGDPETVGRIRFSILTKDGAAPSDVPPLQACVRFDLPTVEPLCTALAPVRLAEGPLQNTGLQSILQCAPCPWYCEVCEKLGVHTTWLCILILVLAGLLLLLVLWLLRKIF